MGVCVCGGGGGGVRGHLIKKYIYFKYWDRQVLANIVDLLRRLIRSTKLPFNQQF